MDALKPSGKPFEITKWEVWEAYRQVKANRGAPGVDGVTIEEFDKDLKNNLYKIWNRMSSGSYFPPPVMAVEIPKPHGGGTRILGVPTISDRVAQTVVARRLELKVEPIFHPELLWLSPVPVGPGRGGGMPGAVLGDPPGDRFGHPKVFRQRRSRSHGQGGGSPRRGSVGGAVCEAVADRPAGTARRDVGSSGIEVPRRGPRSRRCWPTCSCTMRSTPGWLGSTRASGSSVTPTTWSCTV